MHDESPQGRAPLTGCAGGREDHPAQRQIDIGARGDDGGIVAAELEQDLAEALGHDRPDLTSHPHRSGRRDQGDALIADHGIADVPTADEDGREVLRCPHLGGGPGQQGLGPQRCEHGVLRGLPHDCIAGNQGQRGVPGVHGHGEVECGDDPDDAEGVPRLHEPVTRPFAGHGLAPQLPGLTEREFADIDHLLHLTGRLGGSLAGFDGDDLRQVLLVLAEQLSPPLRQLAADGRGHVPPGLERGLGCGDLVARRLRGVRGDRAEVLSRDGGAGRQARRGGRPLKNGGVHSAGAQS